MSDDKLSIQDPLVPKSKNRRKTPRAEGAPTTYCYWTDPTSGKEQMVGIRDLSQGGIGLLLPQAFDIGQKHRLRLANSQRGVDCWRSVTLVSEPICLPNDTWLHGCEFADPLTPAELTLLQM